LKASTPRGRPHDARATQEAILNAAEVVFAENGFDGARIDAIAAAAGYNKSLIFHYFDDKLGLYSAMLQRDQRQAIEMQVRIFDSLLAEDTISAGAFRDFLERVVRATFDYDVAHPRLLRIFAWEEAEGWTTMAKVPSGYDQKCLERFVDVFDRVRRAGVLRPGVSLLQVMYVVVNTCRAFITSLPLFQKLAGPGNELARPEALTLGREQIVALVVHGLMPDFPAG